MNQLNHLLRKTIQCLEALEKPHSRDNCWSKRCKCDVKRGQTFSFFASEYFYIYIANVT